jgi:xanthine dehydrogenase accessory factor
MTHSHDHDADALCDVAHGEAPDATADRTLVAVFASPVADYLLRYGADLGFRAILFEPDASRATGESPFEVVTTPPAELDGGTDIVFTDHHRPELATVLHELLGHKSRWIGVMGSPRHQAPYLPELAELGATPEDLARVHRPIGLNIGSRTPPEIAIATLAGLLADRNDRPGGFHF